MNRSKFTETDIYNILKKTEAEISVVDICREHGIGNASFNGSTFALKPYQMFECQELSRVCNLVNIQQRFRRLMLNHR